MNATTQNLAQNADALDAAQANEERNSRECQCGNFADAETGARLVCDRETQRTFAPGHDARLKGFLIKVGAQGHAVRTLGGQVVSAEQAANIYGFGHMVAAGIKRAGEKAFEKELAKVRKAAKKSHETPREVTCKVGRWTYEGVITDSPNHGPQFTYTSRKGVQTTTTKFTRV